MLTRKPLQIPHPEEIHTIPAAYFRKSLTELLAVEGFDPVGRWGITSGP